MEILATVSELEVRLVDFCYVLSQLVVWQTEKRRFYRFWDLFSVLVTVLMMILSPVHELNRKKIVFTEILVWFGYLNGFERFGFA